MRRLVSVVLFLAVFLVAAPWLAAGPLYFVRTGIESFTATGPNGVFTPLTQNLVTNNITPQTGGEWLDNGTNSYWIGPPDPTNTTHGTLGMQYSSTDPVSADRSQIAPGDYLYTFTFDLTGQNLSYVQIIGNWAADGRGTGIRINGYDTGYATAEATPGTTGSYTAWASFTIDNSDCGPGGCFNGSTNELTFIVNNGLFESGLNVDATIELPEPATYLFISSGLLVLAAVRRWRYKLPDSKL